MARPNILSLYSDEHSYRFMGHIPAEEGGEPAYTPNLDRMASQGTVFSNSYCQMPLCTPSRFCILTGLEVRRCGAWTNQAVLRPELPTIPRTLADAGYETCLVGKMHLGGSLQFAGFKHRPYGDLTVPTEIAELVPSVSRRHAPHSERRAEAQPRSRSRRRC